MKIAHSSPWITSEDIESVTQRLQGRLLAQGDAVKTFENNCSRYLEQKYVTATSSGTAALILALQKLNIQPGDEVILPSYCCHAVEDAVRHVGASPILCDIGERGWSITAKTVSAVITPKTKAIIAVHTFGIPCDIEPICDLGIAVIEDCCQYFHKNAGNFGQLSIFSFHATKCLTTGEGGMVTSNHPLNIDVNLSVMSDLQAALGNSQLTRYPKMLERRNLLAERYNEAFQHSSIENAIYFRYPIIVESSYENIAPKFEEKGISVRRGVDMLLHRKNNIPDNKFLNTVDRFNKTISIPLYPSLSNKQVDKIIDVATKVLL